MTNAQKLTTAKERAEAFKKFCDHECGACPLYGKPCHTENCQFYWLDLEAEEEDPLPCPFCGKSCSTKFNFEDRLVVECDYCTYSTASYDDEMKAIAAHNRVARAAKESNDANA